MNRIILSLSTVIVLLSLISCEGGLLDKELTVSIEGVENATETTIPLAIGATMSVKPRYGNVDDPRQFEWSSSAPEILSVSSDGTLTAHQGGEAAITLRAKDGGESITLRFKVPGSPHDDIYMAQETPKGWFLFINGKQTDELCNLLTTDEDGNIYRGYFNKGSHTVSVSKNGKELATNLPFNGSFVNSFKAAKGKLCLSAGDEKAEKEDIYIISDDGSVIRSSFENGDDDPAFDNGSVFTNRRIKGVDVDDSGNAVFCGEAWTQTWFKYPLYLTIAPDGTKTHEMMGEKLYLSNVAGFGIDGSGNKLVFVEYETHPQLVGVDKDYAFGCGYYKNGGEMTPISDLVESWGTARESFAFRGNDFYVLLSEIASTGSHWSEVKFAVNLYKNGKKQYSVVPSGENSGVCVSVTKSGTVYSSYAQDMGCMVYKGDEPVLYFTIDVSQGNPTGAKNYEPLPDFVVVDK